MGNFTDIFIRRRTLSLVVSLLIFLIGLRAMMELGMRQFPHTIDTVITVETTYPGASAELMQGFITTPIEQAIATIEGLDYLESTSSSGRSRIRAHIELNYSPGQAMTDVMATVQQVKYQLPREANDPVITRTTGDSFATLFMNFTSDVTPRPLVYDYVKRVVTPMLASVDGVGNVRQVGAPLAMRIWLNPARMTARNVTAEDVTRAIRANNFQSAPGAVKGAYTLSSITADTGLVSTEDFQNMIVKSAGGALVRMKDIAQVEIGSSNYNARGIYNGEEAVNVSLALSPTGNPLSISRDVRVLMPEIRRAMPEGMEVELVWDASVFINAAIQQVITTLSEAVIIVIAVIFVFLGSLRAVIIPIVTIPLSLVGSCIVMMILGFSINLLTLLALVLAIGLVVDDAIVVVENVHRHIEDGQTPFHAALIGAREIAGPVIAMAITLAAVYAPIGFIGGLTGSLFQEFAFTLATAVIVSGIVALTLSPMMCSNLLQSATMDSKLVQKIDHIFARLSAFYSERLNRVLNYRAPMNVFIVGVFAAVALMFFNAARELAPADDQGIVLMNIVAPETANIDYTMHYMREADAILQKIPEVQLRVAFAGLFGGPNVATVAAPLVPWNERSRTAQELVTTVQAQANMIQGARGLAFTFPPLPGNMGYMPVGFVLGSPASYNTLFEEMEGLKTKARESGLFQVIDSDLSFDSAQIRLKIDRDKANDLGISMEAIGTTLATMTGENYTNRFSLEGRSYEVIAQVPRALRLTQGSLTRFYVRTASGQEIPLSTIVTVASESQPKELKRFNQLNAATLQAVPAIGVSMGEVVDFLRDYATSLPKHMQTAFVSESRKFTEEGNKLFITFVLSLIIIYLVLAAQYESLRDPLVILVSVPMSACGALLPIFFGVTTMNIYTQIGLITLIGLISKHGILMVSFARTMQIEGNCDRRTAIEHAARVRLRPILMTTAAMIAGLLPLVFASGAGAESRFALGVVVVAGMSVGTLFTLFVLPSVYVVLATDHRAAAALARSREIAMP